MTLFGEISQARDWLVRSKKSGVPIHKFELSWIAILNAYARESNKQEVVRTIKIINEMEPWDERLTNGVISAFATLRDAHHVKYYYEEAVSKGISITPQTTSLVVKHCVRVLDHKWMYNIVRTLVAKTELSRIDWETIFLWALAIRRGVDEVARMMRVLVARTKDHGRPVELNINTINMLIDVCHSWHDSYTAERFVTLGRIRRIIPNATTYILQMRYRLSVGDIDGAIIAYKRFRPQNTDEIKDNEDGPTVNRLLENMITSGKYSTDSILSIVDDLTERQVRFEPDTVAAMSGFHLQRDELHDAIDLLMTHTCNYSLGERTKVADTLITICVDTHKSPSLAWDTYSILAAIFPDTPRSKREDVMEAFFKRQKAEMAVHVFSDFRRHDNPDIRANNESYVKAFVGISDVGDVDSLDVVHNTMKVDVNVNLDTRLLNALMLAHIGCDMPQRALVYWDQIFKSPEGPNYNSIMIAFRACEKAPFGFEKAQPLWNRLRRLDIEISREMFASYVGALAGNAMVDEAIELVESGRRDFGFEPDVLTLGAMFNATAGYVKQEQVEKYIRRSYYNVWAELEKIGIHENSWRMKYVKMNRRLSP
ncbi:hypothetical protein K490DRAFT_39497 [Saccharata proteae CBS 121410]|uniref:Uncharacterized protein n=1 Tax=Saccharata proteae CBS 121410 TaxID=1314787 RepID=A0A9P4HX85_9PEZI|nr:hypothetical protein K490DRAFT_39497 [Saccharata proteae CBS 121410]